MGKKEKKPGLLASGYGKFRAFVLDQRYLPRWAVMVIDLSICLASYLITLAILRDTPLKFLGTLSFFEKGVVLVGLHLLGFILFRSYSGIIRHSTFTDVYRLAMATASVLFVSLAINMISQIITGEKIFLTTGLLLYTFFSLSLLIAFRIT